MGYILITKEKCGPVWCGSVDCTLACELKGYEFHSQSGHMPELWVRVPGGGA